MSCDRRGADVYTSSVQTQGSGYWFGTGLLADGEGNDQYDARYYMQGAGAHFAMAIFLESSGDDRYNQNYTPTATSIGESVADSKPRAVARVPPRHEHQHDGQIWDLGAPLRARTYPWPLMTPRIRFHRLAFEEDAFLAKPQRGPRF